MQITSLELWNELEGKILDISKSFQKVDYLLCGRLDNLVNHFNGNLSKNKQYVCIENIEQISSNLKKESYYRDRKYTQEEINKAVELNEELSIMLKVLKSEYKASFKKIEEDKKVEDRLPNINVDKAVKMYEIVKD